MIWRGPMVTSAINQMLRDVDWGELDVPGRRPAARHRRRPAHPGAEGAALRRGHRLDAAGRRAARRPQGPQHVPQGRRAGPRHHREHELLRLPALRRTAATSSPMAARAREAERLGRRVPGRDPARHRDPRDLRQRPARSSSASPIARTPQPTAPSRSSVWNKLGRRCSSAKARASSCSRMLAARATPAGHMPFTHQPSRAASQRNRRSPVNAAEHKRGVAELDRVSSSSENAVRSSRTTPA